MAANFLFLCQNFGFVCIGSILADLPLHTFFMRNPFKRMNQVNEKDQEVMTEELNQAGDAGLNTDENAAGTLGLNQELVEDLLSETLKKELDEQKDKYLRLFAEFDNFKRRTAVEKNELRATGGREIMTALLDVMDDFERTEKVLADSTDLDAVKQGVNLVFTKLRNTLEQKGLKAMNSVHTNFNADLHEAITEIPAPSEELKGKVIDELQKGYSLGGKIIRYAKVVVGK
jgi:molecular chaperone GrpE